MVKLNRLRLILIILVLVVLSNYHGHSEYCDGRESIENHVLKAIELGIRSLGISSHNPIPGDPPWTMRRDRYSDYSNDIDRCRKAYADQIELYKGLELDYLPDLLPPMSQAIDYYQLDYAVGSVHYAGFFADGRPWEIDGPHELFRIGLKEIFSDNIRHATENYYRLIREMLMGDPPTILGHLDKIKMQNSRSHYFNESDDWYRNAVMETLLTIKNSGVIMEVNTRGIYKGLTEEPYPSYWVLREALDLDIPITVSSDAHRPEELINEFDNVCKELSNIGFKKVMALKAGEWTHVEIG